MSTGPRELGVVARPGMMIRRPKTSGERDRPSVRALETRIFVKGLILEAEAGVYTHEKGARRPLVIDIEVCVDPGVRPQNDQLSETVDYDALVAHARAVCAEGHIHLIETVAERIAARCLGDERVLSVRVRIEKPGAIPGAACSGVEVARAR
jgi:7,8-dihydroneopterin aldolase/epimerase/oxygenase